MDKVVFQAILYQVVFQAILYQVVFHAILYQVVYLIYGGIYHGPQPLGGCSLRYGKVGNFISPQFLTRKLSCCLYRVTAIKSIAIRVRNSNRCPYLAMLLVDSTIIS